MASSMMLACCFLVALLIQKVFSACENCNFVTSRATYYGSPDSEGTAGGACGYGSYGRNLNGGDVACVAQLYRNGAGCGACYQVKCTNEDLCTEDGVNIVVTDYGEGDRTDFILSYRGYTKLARSGKANELVAMGVVAIQFKRVSCQYPGTSIMFKIDENSNFPGYLAFIFWFQGGQKDVSAVHVCKDDTLECKLSRNYGAVWNVMEPPKGALSVRFLVSDGDEEQWMTAPNVIPANWTKGALYDSGIQIN